MSATVENLVLQTPQRVVPRIVIPPRTVGKFESVGSVHETRLQEVLSKERERGYNKFLLILSYHDANGALNAGQPGYLYEVKRAK